MSDDTHMTSKMVAGAISSGLSIVGALYILIRYWQTRHLISRVAAANTTQQLDVIKELIHVLAWLDLIGAIGRIFSVLPTYTIKAGQETSSLCNLQAFVVTFGDGSPIAWNLVMAVNLYWWVCRGEDQQRLQKNIKYYLLGTILINVAIPALALSFNRFGDAGLWCWVLDDYNYWKLGVLYIWVILGGIALIVLLILVKINVKKRLEAQVNDDARRAYHEVVYNLTIYISGFLICWIPPVLDRGYNAITGRTLFVLSMLHVSVVSLQGFVNAIIYGKFHGYIGRRFAKRQAKEQREGRTGSKGASGDDAKVLQMGKEEERQQLGTASIFVTTFDMDWRPFPRSLDKWVPPEKDLYVFSLQHCSDFSGAEACIRQHLMRINYPMAYRSITTLAGASARVGREAAVCQIVFVNKADDLSGNFQFRPADGRIWSQKKSLKEVAGIPFRYFDASLAFVSCNLGASFPSHLATTGNAATSAHNGTFVSEANGGGATSGSLHGSSTIPLSSYPSLGVNAKKISIEEKHATSADLIRSFGMDTDQANVEFPYLYHHTFLSGNLNYDIAAPASKLVSSLDQAYKAECLKRSTDQALDTKVAPSSSDELYTYGRDVEETERIMEKMNMLAGPLGGKEGKQEVEHNQVGGNVAVDWDLLYFDTQARSSASSGMSMEEGAEYDQVFTSNHDNMPFTLLRSPVTSSDTSFDAPVSRFSFGNAGAEDKANEDWNSFLDHVFSTEDGRETMEKGNPIVDRMLARARSRTSSMFAESMDASSLQRLPRSERRKFVALMSKSGMIEDKTRRQWQALLRYDELRAALEAKEAFCGFEEPPIRFLPTFPRDPNQVASYSMVYDRTCHNQFLGMNGGDASSMPARPAYKDRILSHSLTDTKERLRNVAYWVCEDVVSSTHKPVCSVYELEVDRFFAYKLAEAEQSDQLEGIRGLKDKKGVMEFRLKLVNLDANIWTYRYGSKEAMTKFSHGLRRYTRSSAREQEDAVDPTDSTISEGRGLRDQSFWSSAASSKSSSSTSNSRGLRSSANSRKGSISSLMNRMLSRAQSRELTSNVYNSPYTTFSARSKNLSSYDLREESLEVGSSYGPVIEPIEPETISTVFPLPSEDVYALQRKVYEVAHSVTGGFSSIAKDGEVEDSFLAYTNSRSMKWTEAGRYGVMHSAVTRAVNGAIHVAICIEAAKGGGGGQGVLCIKEEDMLKNAGAELSAATPIPFDLSLTWGGKHVGYLHGDVLTSF